MKYFGIVILLISLVGCAPANYQYSGGQMIPGQLISLEDGVLLPLQIELSTGQGKVNATNPKTGEVLGGKYTAIPETKYVQYSTNTWLGPQDTQQAVEISSSVPATAVLVGDKGTVINLTMRIKPGNGSVAPIGYGEGTDNKGRKYNCQF